jgi:predicted ATPase/DNA-binding SARP family transcriptional activator
MSEPTLVLLGTPCLTRDGVTVGLSSRKALALLAYLAVTGARHSRPTLAALFWPESDRQRALKSLRYTLWILRKALEGRWLVADRETVGLDGSQESAVDVVRFRHLLAPCRAHDHDVRQTCAQCLPLLGEAVELYQGDFLAGFTLPDSVEFDAWQSLETEALRQELVSALERLVEGHAAQGDVERASAYARRWLAVDPLDEGAHRALMRLYAGSGRMTAALRQYEACAQVLTAELSVSPGRETVDLYERIRAGGMPQVQVCQPMVSAPPCRPRHNLPRQPTAFVGREDELDQVARRLANPDCRLLTVVGPGGMGKSRLAIQAGEEHLPAFSDGVWFVALASLGSADLLPWAIMEALDAPRSGGQDPQTQLLNYLRERHLLLILDSFEHLPEGTPLVTEIVRAAAGIKMLVTSRERLNLRGEWLFPLRGMDVPEGEVAIQVGGEGDVIEQAFAVVEKYSAVELFLQCAQQVQPELSLGSAGPASVVHICRLVEGMPLAIELAASWVRMIDCEEIAREIEEGLDFLTTRLRDVPQRHRSMRAVFDHSWELLSAEERSVLRKLSVFRGGFRREAAEAVAIRPGQSPASLLTLAALVDRSWVRRSPSGRYEMHELVRQYCGRLLDEVQTVAEQGEGQRVRDLHSDYYATLLHEREATLQQRETLEEVMEEVGNVRAAWDWALERGHPDTIYKCTVAFYTMYNGRGWLHEAVQVLDKTAASLREQLRATERRPGDPVLEGGWMALSRVLQMHSEFSRRMGSVEQAIVLAEESVASAGRAPPSVRQREQYAYSMGTLASTLHNVGEYYRADELYRQAYAQLREVGPRWLVAILAFGVGLNASRLGEWAEAESFLEQAAAIYADTPHTFGAAYLRPLSFVLCAKGDYERAEQLAREFWQSSQALGSRNPAALMALGGVATALGRYELAGQHYQEGLAIAEETGDLNSEVTSLNGLATVALALGQYAEAKQLFDRSLAAATEGWQSLVALIGLGNTNSALGETQQARQLLCQALEEAVETGSMPEAMDALVGLAYLSAREEEPERADFRGPSASSVEPLSRAAELLALALHHPTTTQMTKDRARDLLSRLEAELPPEVFAAAMERGQARDLDDVAAEVLRAW